MACVEKVSNKSSTFTDFSLPNDEKKSKNTLTFSGTNARYFTIATYFYLREFNLPLH